MGCAASSFPDTSETSDFFAHYALGKKLGEGSFGQVRQAQERTSHGLWAVKIADTRKRNSDGNASLGTTSHRKTAIKREILMWQKSSETGCPQIVGLKRHFFSDGLFYMVCELCKHGDLMASLLSQKSVTEGQLAHTCREMLIGVGHCHKLNLVHRDIKPENFLWGGATGKTLKLCDFGLTVKRPRTPNSLQGVNGTAPYMAPEMLNCSTSFFKNGRGYDREVDLWSMGVIVYLILFCRFPYMPEGHVTADSMKRAIKNDSPALAIPDLEQVRGSPVKDFLKGLLVRRQSERLSAEAAMEHAFVSRANFEPEHATKSFTNEHFADDVKRVKSVADKFKSDDFALHQRNIDALLKLVTTKSGGEWFSEGDQEPENPPTQEAATVTKADGRIRTTGKKSPVNASKFGTHSGVVTEKVSPTDLDKGPNARVCGADLRVLDIPEIPEQVERL